MSTVFTIEEFTRDRLEGWEVVGVETKETLFGTAHLKIYIRNINGEAAILTDREAQLYMTCVKFGVQSAALMEIVGGPAPEILSGLELAIVQP